MKELLTYIIRNILPKDARLTIEEQVSDNLLIYHIQVSPEVVGILVGKEGGLIKAIKTLLKASPESKNKEIILKVNKMEEEKNERKNTLG